MSKTQATYIINIFFGGLSGILISQMDIHKEHKSSAHIQ